ncbi:hypothetical protein [Sphingobacterium sp. FBM7-1]|uniref:hypothetical protein n=1 Tax=Sphingobacterium sp. FBM7-1 TaxID=2886688 RepID=UPI001D1100C7|nr:hypothetical protein [Sphingobacterium sp. FBM7-1]MCC2600325.1 hypothetical protein [Sphingobacterium sp. FBM7-1]
MRKTLILLIALFVYCNVQLHAQMGDPVLLESTLQGMAKQLTTYPQEKIHLHLDRSTYYPGDSIRFRAYMVHSTFHTPIHFSRYIYTELVNPFDEVVSTTKIRDTDTTTMAGYLVLNDELPAGNYLLRAYTAYMASDSLRHFFSRSITIVPPAWEAFDVQAQTPLGQSKSTLSLHLWDSFSSSPIQIGGATATLSNGATAGVPIVQNRLQPAFRSRERSDNRSMLLEVTDVNNDRYRKYIPLATDRADFAVTCYPEGGYLLEGIACRVGFRAKSQTGHDKDVTVEVLDDSDNVVVKANTVYAGLGSFIFTPEAGRAYRVRSKDRFGTVNETALPAALTDGIGIQVETTDSTYIVSLQAAAQIDQSDIALLAHVRGAVLYFAPWQESRKRYIFDKRLFPSGVVQFLLLDGQSNPLAERLVFSSREDEIGMAQLSLNKDIFEKRDKVEAVVSLQSRSGDPLSGDFSVAVTDKATGMTDTAHSILATLLLSSELRGTIENPSFYLRDDHLSKEALDLLLLVKGWRRYDLPAVLKGHIAKPKRNPEQFMQITGQVKAVSVFDWSKDYAVRIRGTNNAYRNDVRTDNKRTFVFDSLEYADGAGFHISAIKKGEYFPEGDRYIQLNQIEEVSVDNDVLQDPLSEYIGIPEDLLDTVPLVTRRGRDFLIKPVQVYPPYWGSTEYMQFTLREVGRLPYHDMTGLLKHMGLRISAGAPLGRVDSEPDNFIYSNKDRVALFVNGEPMPYHSNVLYELKLSDLEEIVFLPFVTATTLNRLAGLPMGKRDGLRGLFDLYSKEDGMPALHIVTREGFDTRNFGERFIPRFSGYAPRSTVFPMGYQPPVEFYYPIYDTPEKKEDPAPDQRETVYWNPALKPDANGVARFSFYTTDEPGTYSIIVEGISEKGEMVREIVEMAVKDEDVKINE